MPMPKRMLYVFKRYAEAKAKLRLDRDVIFLTVL